MVRVARDRYERRLAETLQMAHAVTFGFSRHALTAILSANGIGEGHDVVLSPLTCKVVPLALMSLGIRPRYADVDRRTLNLDPGTADAAVGPSTRAILFQHTYGSLLGVSDVAAVAVRRELPLIEDCAQCLPIRAPGYAPGHWGLAAIFSNNLMKPMPTGSGGLAATNDPALAAKIRIAQASSPNRSAMHEWRRRAEVLAHRHLVRPALYWRLFDLSRRLTSTYRSRPVADEIATDIAAAAGQISERQAADGERGLSRIGALADHRRGLCSLYRDRLTNSRHIEVPSFDAASPLCYFPVLVPRKDALLRVAQRRAVPIVPWPMRTPLYPVEDEQLLREYGYQIGSCPIAEAIAQRLVGLPTDAWMTAQHAQQVVDLITAHDAGDDE